MNKQQPLGPGWVENHIPAKGSQRSFSSLSRPDAFDWREARPSRGPMQAAAQVDTQEQRALSKLERLAR